MGYIYLGYIGEKFFKIKLKKKAGKKKNTSKLQMMSFSFGKK